MSDKRNVVKVRITGEEYTIRSDEAPEHVIAVAAHVDQAIKRVVDSGAMLEPHRAAILAALQITDELFKAREDAKGSDAAIRALSHEIRRWLPPAKRGRDTPVGEDVARVLSD
ncbi:MAG: cell division protein ZapA [Gemmatimonadaceae bacterium]